MNKLAAVSFFALGIGLVAVGCQPADDDPNPGTGGMGGTATGGTGGTGGRRGGTGGTSTMGGTGGTTTGGMGGTATAGMGGTTTGGMGGTSTGGMGGTAGRGGTGGTAMGGTGGGNFTTCSADPSYLPFKIGNKWTYRVIDPFAMPGAAPEMKENLIEKPEAIPTWTSTAVRALPGAAMSHRVTTKKGAALADLTVSWQNVVSGKVVRYAEEAYATGTTTWNTRDYWNPARLRSDDAKFGVVGMFNEVYTEYKQAPGMALTMAMHTDTWTITRINVPTTVPAGTFNTIEIKKKGAPPDDGKTYYFAKGCGKVKEVGRIMNGTKVGQDEELVTVVIK